MASEANPGHRPTDHEVVTELIGRKPMGAFEVLVRREDGSPVVLANLPLLDDGRPMPTRFWLADKALNKAIGRLESTGAVNQAEAEIGEATIQIVHDAYEAERNTHIDPSYKGHRPTGGVGGTRVGVKCLHAHYANLLAGADDPVGRWVQDKLVLTGDEFDPSQPGILSSWPDRANPEAGAE